MQSTHEQGSATGRRGEEDNNCGGGERIKAREDMYVDWFGLSVVDGSSDAFHSRAEDHPVGDDEYGLG